MLFKIQSDPLPLGCGIFFKNGLAVFWKCFPNFWVFFFKSYKTYMFALISDPAVSPSVRQFVSLSVCQFVSLSVRQFVSPSVRQFVSPSVRQSVSLSVFQYVSLSFCQSISPSVCQSVNLSSVLQSDVSVSIRSQPVSPSSVRQFLGLVIWCLGLSGLGFSPLLYTFPQISNIILSFYIIYQVQ